ncbi:MAG: ADP-ribosylglycohydrolase family protein [Saprospiraceae bacterium]|nr:ADP-ribosylglycohydrolase family protein [Saprospiraceae bacterium]
MDHIQRMALAKTSLKGLSIGDAFGESFFGDRDEVLQHIQERKLPKTSWEFTDDTVLALCIYNQLKKKKTIDQDQLAQDFATNHAKDVNRGYGATARRILREIEEGGDWRTLSTEAFDGMGSMGNGASTRTCVIGAYFHDNLHKVVKLSKKAAKITHSNPEGVAGAIAVGVATAQATQLRLKGQQMDPVDFIMSVVNKLPDTDLKAKMNKSTAVPYDYTIETVKSILGNGSKIQAQDTVPFAIWCAAHNLNSFQESLWKAISILGDRDTICAIVGCITILTSDKMHIPFEWVMAVEDFEKSVFMPQ